MSETKLRIDKKKDVYSSLELIKDSWIFLNGYKLKFFFYAIILTISSSASFLIAYLIGKIVDFFVSYQAGQSLANFYWFVAIIGLAGGIQVWLRFLAKWNMQGIGSNVRMNARVLAMTKLIDFELKWHEKEETGSKIQKISIGSESLYKNFSFFIDRIIPTLTGIIGSFALFIFLNWKYALFSSVYLCIYLIGEYYFNKKISYWQDQMNKIREKVSGKIHESASNVLTVKSMGLRDVFQKSMQDYESQYLDIWLNARKANQSKFRAVKIFAAVCYALFILMVGFDAVAGMISIGSIIVFINYFARLKSALEDVTNSLGEFIEMKSGVGRLMTILDKKTLLRESSNLSDVSLDWKSIEFKNVGFKYKDKWILKNFNLKINRDEKLGIVGRSGCGKSTLVKLVLGLYKLQQGSITIDGIQLDKYKQSSITKTIAVVLQDSEMFNASLGDNISISAIKSDEILLKNAIGLSELNSFISRLPNGINTLMGEKGYKVSGGERQRVGIARAIYRNNDVLILDEATSHLDSKTEAIIQANLEKFLINKTLVVIAHRISTLKKVDRIIVMDNGRIIEEGNFNELLKKRGEFYQLYMLQKRKDAR